MLSLRLLLGVQSVLVKSKPRTKALHTKNIVPMFIAVVLNVPNAVILYRVPNVVVTSKQNWFFGTLYYNVLLL